MCPTCCWRVYLRIVLWDDVCFHGYHCNQWTVCSHIIFFLTIYRISISSTAWRKNEQGFLSGKCSFYVPESSFFFLALFSLFHEKWGCLGCKKGFRGNSDEKNSSEISLVSYFHLISFRHLSKVCILQTTFSLLFIRQQYCIVYLIIVIFT